MTGKASRRPVIVVLGPTGIGKTHTAIAIAQALNGEIIGADSRQVYRYMDIGTAKPTAAERAAAPHHLIDVVLPDDNLSLERYQRLAYALIDKLHQDDKLPLVVGGTGQYITAVVEGWAIPEVPPNDPLRAELETLAAEKGAVALHQRLMSVDPDSAQRIHPNNIRRVIRSLEVYYATGQPFSALQQKSPPPYDFLQLGLMMDRASLKIRNEKRIDGMMGQGFLEEVRSLLAMGYAPALPSMSGLGYAQLAAHLRDEVSLDEAIQQTKTATHDFVRRQMTWFRGHDNGILWHDVQYTQVTPLIDSCVRWLKERC